MLESPCDDFGVEWTFVRKVFLRKWEKTKKVFKKKSPQGRLVLKKKLMNKKHPHLID